MITSHHTEMVSISCPTDLNPALRQQSFPSTGPKIGPRFSKELQTLRIIWFSVKFRLVVPVNGVASPDNVRVGRSRGRQEWRCMVRMQAVDTSLEMGYQPLRRILSLPTIDFAQ